MVQNIRKYLFKKHILNTKWDQQGRWRKNYKIFVIKIIDYNTVLQILDLSNKIPETLSAHTLLKEYLEHKKETQIEQ